MKVIVSLIQDSPIFFDKKETLLKVEKYVEQEAQKGAQLIVFPESFVPAYPRGFSFGSTIGSRSDEGRDLFAVYHKQSFQIDSEDCKKLEKLAKKHQVYLVLGVTEKSGLNGSLYCSMLYFSPINGLIGVHRKIKPTGVERLIWAESDGNDLVSFDTKIGRLGGLICWENYMPLARMAMYQKNVEIYIAPTADSRDTWTSTMQHIAQEGRCFVLGCNQYVDKTMIPKQYHSQIDFTNDVLCKGGSVIVSPSGKIIAGPLFDEVGVLRAELDLEEIIKQKLDFDVIGHYSRNDIFEFKVVGQPEMKSDFSKNRKRK